MVCRLRHPLLKDSTPAPILGNQFGNFLIHSKEVNLVIECITKLEHFEFFERNPLYAKME
jgi:hypothetical protein